MAFAELKMQIVVTLAGRSSRFKAQGVHTAKPLLPVAGKPMVSYALESVRPLLSKAHLLGVVCAEDRILGDVQKIFTDFSADAIVHEISDRTAGPVQTVLSIADQLDKEASLLVLDGDIYFTAHSFINRLLNDPPFTDLPGGTLLSFPSSSPAFSYIREGVGQRIVQIAEKKVISKSALIGAYHFRTARDFIETGKSLVATHPQKEHFISHIIARLLEDGADFQFNNCDSHLSFGTPEELAHSERLLI